MFAHPDGVIPSILRLATSLATFSVLLIALIFGGAIYGTLSENAAVQRLERCLGYLSAARTPISEASLDLYIKLTNECVDDGYLPASDRILPE